MNTNELKENVDPECEHKSDNKQIHKDTKFNEIRNALFNLENSKTINEIKFALRSIKNISSKSEIDCYYLLKKKAPKSLFLLMHDLKRQNDHFTIVKLCLDIISDISKTKKCSFSVNEDENDISSDKIYQSTDSRKNECLSQVFTPIDLPVSVLFEHLIVYRDKLEIFYCSMQLLLSAAKRVPGFLKVLNSDNHRKRQIQNLRIIFTKKQNAMTINNKHCLQSGGILNDQRIVQYQKIKRIKDSIDDLLCLMDKM